ANDFFYKLSRTPRPKKDQDLFWFSMGGPKFLAKPGEGGKGNLKPGDKAFWFFSYYGLCEKFAVSTKRTVFTDIAKTGIVRYTGSNGVTQAVNVLALGANGTLGLNPVTMEQINAMPSPNNSLVGDSFNTSGFRFNVTGTDPNDKWVFRYD